MTKRCHPVVSDVSAFAATSNNHQSCHALPSPTSIMGLSVDFTLLTFYVWTEN